MMVEHVHGAAKPSGTFLQFMQGLFDTDFMRRADCVFQRPEIIWLHVISDAVIALAYYSIPIALIVLVRKRKDLAFNWIFIMFAGFILACGTTHVLGIFAFWYPMYRLDGVMKGATAGISIITAIALWPLIPKAIALPGPGALRSKNHELELYASALRETQQDLQRSHAELEHRVIERTAELAKANEHLRTEAAARAKVEADLRLSDSRFRLALRDAPIVVFTQDRSRRCTWMHNSCFGMGPEQLIGKRDEDVFDPESAARAAAIKQRVIDTGVGVRERFEASRRGEHRVFDMLIEPLRDEQGDIVGITGVSVDITEHSQIELDLAFQKYALDQHAIVAITDHRGRITYVNEKFCAISKYPREELIGQDHRILNSGFHPKSFFKDMYASISKGQVWRGEIRNRAKDGSIYWVDTTIVPMMGADGKVTNYVAIRSDITARKEVEERQRFLVAELDHRVKNNLAVVLSIAQETMRHTLSKNDFGDAFIGRIRALARTHAALAATKWEGASLTEIIRVTLQAHFAEGSNRVLIAGEDVFLSHRAASVLCMTFNELATNAAKYGSLSTHTGQVRIEWRSATDDHGDAVIELVWTETGGPAVQVPTRRGLGSQFIVDSVKYELDGTVEMHYLPAGFRCNMTLPCEAILSEQELAAADGFGNTR